MNVAIVLEGMSYGYSIGQVTERAVMTVGELRGLLEDYEDDNLVILSRDNGYTYGTLALVGEAVERDGEWDLEYGW